MTLEVCNSSGEPQSLMLGLFENYLNRRMKDASLQTVSVCRAINPQPPHLFVCLAPSVSAQLFTDYSRNTPNLVSARSN